jgi:multidrug efflux pump subunit AcrA (membrane-fusion protein)
MSEEQEHFEEGEEAAPPGVRAMAVVRWVLVLAMAGAAAASLLYAFRQHGHAEGSAARATQYYCPMHPGVVQDQPGDCPICGMTLVAREPAPPPAVRTTHHKHHKAASAEGESIEGLVPIDLPPERVQLIGMRTAKVGRGELPSELRAVGYVAPAESGLAVVETRYTGWIQELHVKQTGQAVTRGQLLARIYSPELLSAQQELLNAKRWANGDAGPAASFVETARRRLLLLGMQPEELAEVERSGELHQLVEIRSPARGYVAQRTAVEGLYIQPGTRLFEIADLSKVWVIADIPERDAGRIRSGQNATFELTAYPGEALRGKVEFLYPTLNAETRSLRARIELKNPELRLRPGMFGDVSISLAASQGLSIPSEAVVDTGEHQYVFLAEPGGHFTPRAVRLGARSGERVQVLAGLKEGESVVTAGNFLIDSESRLRAAVEGKVEAREHEPAAPVHAH